MLKPAASLGIVLLVAAGCASLPDTDALIERHTGQAARFENARGPLSARQSAAVLAELQRRSGDLDVLEKQIVLEQAIGGGPLVLGNRITLLEDGAAAYPAMIAAIRAARDHVNMQTYIIEDDEVGRQFSDLLLEQQARGIQVNLIYDSFGTYDTPPAFFERLRAGGIALLEFNPINPLKGNTAWRINNRDHRKLLVVDGHTAFLGGINISSVYSAGSIVNHARGNGAAWRDTDLRIEGPVVRELQKLFVETWEKQRAAPLADRTYFPTLERKGSEIVRAIGSTPDDPYSLMYLTLVSAIGNAEKHVYLTNAYFVPDPQLLKALTGAAARGVDVRLLLPAHSDSQVVFHAGRSHYASLLQAGVKIHERTGALLHAKTALIDGVWSTVGSSNLDFRSALDNDEINAVVIGREFGQRMHAMFAKDLASSEEIDAQRWESRGLALRFKEWMARVWGRLL
jgi:cardiolipin synthase A/B